MSSTGVPAGAAGPEARPDARPDARLVVASSNPGKLREFSALLRPLGFALVAQRELGVSDAEEPHLTFLENALAKARHASAATGLAALADDSGLCVDALAGAPGVHSARYAGLPSSDLANNRKLIAALEATPNRSAHYYCVLVLVRQADDPEPLVAEGRWHGEVSREARGTGGFGYDPYFFLPQLGMSAAELSADDKNRISHRALALQHLIALLRQR